jgi:hypothetical protein
LTVESEPVKRYRLNYGGETIGSWNTAVEALTEYETYERVIRPVTDRAKKYRYSIRDGRTKEMTIRELRAAAKAEEK